MKNGKVNWDVVRTESARLGRFEVILETIALEDGGTGYYSYIKFAKKGVCVLPVLPSGEILMIEQYRRPFDGWLYELPAGVIDDNEEPEQTAKRELMEETGYAAHKLMPCGCFFPSPGSTDECIFLFAARCAYEREPQPEGGEHIRSLVLKKSEIVELLNKNEIRHAAAIILLQKYLLGEFDKVD